MSIDLLGIANEVKLLAMRLDQAAACRGIRLTVEEREECEQLAARLEIVRQQLLDEEDRRRSGKRTGGCDGLTWLEIHPLNEVHDAARS